MDRAPFAVLALAVLVLAASDQKWARIIAAVLMLIALALAFFPALVL
jgi:disulfide bond formation protein DsbB